MEKVYIQTYSLREFMHNDFVGSMRRIAEVGYSGVEFAGGYGGLSVADMKKLLSETGLEVIGSHVGMNDAEHDIEFLAAVGARYIIAPMADNMGIEYDSAMRIAERLNDIGTKCVAAGLKYGYHNHTHEFALLNGKTFLEHLIENTDPQKVIFELDVGWATTAGIDAVAFINKHAGRFELIHAKEAGEVTGIQPPIEWSEVKFVDGMPQLDPELLEQMSRATKCNSKQGTGVVDWKAIHNAAVTQGAQGFVVEREYDYAGDLWQCVSEDLTFMRSV